MTPTLRERVPNFRALCRVRDLIDDAYAEPLTVGRMARAPGFSQHHFLRKFQLGGVLSAASASGSAAASGAVRHTLGSVTYSASLITIAAALALACSRDEEMNIAREPNIPASPRAPSAAPPKPTPPSPAPSASPSPSPSPSECAAFGTDYAAALAGHDFACVRALLLPKLATGIITSPEARYLKAACAALGDHGCEKLAASRI
jgi:hypothetical protein